MSTGPAYPEARARALYEELYARFGALPGVQSVSMSMDTPLAANSRWARGWPYPAARRIPRTRRQVYHNFVGPRFFETMGIPILAGRDFALSDDERAPTYVVISESVARRYFGMARIRSGARFSLETRDARDARPQRWRRSSGL